MKQIIVSLGGSLIVPEEIDVEFLKQFKTFIESYLSQGFRFVIVTGGGKMCRKYQAASALISTQTDEEKDWLGIHCTRLNAFFVKQIFKELAYEEVVINPNKKIVTDKPIIVAAGYKPGCSTDKDCVLLAKKLQINTVINLSNVDYVYDKDPKVHSDAKPITKMTWKELAKIVGKTWKPGMNVPFDPIATKLAKKMDLTVIMVNGKNFVNLAHILEGKEYVGTTITH